MENRRLATNPCKEHNVTTPSLNQHISITPQQMDQTWENHRKYSNGIKSSENKLFYIGYKEEE
jgi:hypothetical protein